MRLTSALLSGRWVVTLADWRSSGSRLNDVIELSDVPVLSVNRARAGALDIAPAPAAGNSGAHRAAMMERRAPRARPAQPRQRLHRRMRAARPPQRAFLQSQKAGERNDEASNGRDEDPAEGLRGIGPSKRGA